MASQPIVASGSLDVDLDQLTERAAVTYAFLGQNRPPARGFRVHLEVETQILLADIPDGGVMGVTVGYQSVGRHPVGDGAATLALVAGGSRVTDIRASELGGQEAFIVTGRNGTDSVAVARQVVTDKAGRLLSFVVRSPQGDAGALLATMLAEGDGPLEGTTTRLKLPFAFRVPSGSRVRERVTVNMRDPNKVALILGVWSAVRDSALDTTPDEQAARAGLEVPLPKVDQHGCQLAGALGMSVGGISTGKPKIATVTYAVKPDGRHLGVTVGREALRTSVLKAPNAFELCTPLADVVTVTAPRHVASPAAPERQADDTGPKPAPRVETPPVEEPPVERSAPPRGGAASSPTRTIPPDRTVIAIDFGTTYTAAAIRRPGGRPEPVTLDSEGWTRIPSGVLADPDGGLRAGKKADNSAAMAPASFEPTPKRCVGFGDVTLGETTYTVEALVAAVLAEVAAEMVRQQGGALDAEILLTYPAIWEGPKQDVLRAAARSAGLGEVSLVPEPVAAACHYASLEAAVPDGATVAVYDLGGGTFDVALVRRESAMQHTVGEKSGVDPLGGVDFDAALFKFLGRRAAEQYPDEWAQLSAPTDRAWRRNRRLTLEQVRLAKEGLSAHPTASVYVPGIEDEFLVIRHELEELIDPMLDQTIDVMSRTLASGGVQPSDLAAIYLVGGSSRIPLVQRRITAAFGISPKTLEDPKLAVVLGAAGVSEVAGSAPISGRY